MAAGFLLAKSQNGLQLAKPCCPGRLPGCRSPHLEAQDVLLQTGSDVDEPRALRPQVPADLRRVHAALLLAVGRQAARRQRHAEAVAARVAGAANPGAVPAGVSSGP